MLILLGTLGVIALGGAFLALEKAAVDATEESGIGDYYTDLARVMYEARKQKENK